MYKLHESMIVLIVWFHLHAAICIFRSFLFTLHVVIMTLLVNSHRKVQIHPPEQLAWFLSMCDLGQKCTPEWFSLTTRLLLHASFSIPPGDALTFQGASPWVPPSHGFPCRMRKRHNWRKYIKHTEDAKENTEKATIECGSRPQIWVSMSHPSSTGFTPLSNLPENVNPPTGPNISIPPPGYYYDM